MIDMEKLVTAKVWIEKLANGINPLNDELVKEDDLIISGCESKELSILVPFDMYEKIKGLPLPEFIMARITVKTKARVRRTTGRRIIRRRKPR